MLTASLVAWSKLARVPVAAHEVRASSPVAEAMDKAVELLLTAGAEVKRVKAAVIESEMQVITAEKNLESQKERLSYAHAPHAHRPVVIGELLVRRRGPEHPESLIGRTLKQGNHLDEALLSL